MIDEVYGRACCIQLDVAFRPQKKCTPSISSASDLRPVGPFALMGRNLFLKGSD